MGKCLVIGNDDQYYGLSGSGDDEPKVQIPDSSDGSKKIISMPRLLIPKKRQNSLYELNQLSIYVSEILKSLAKDKNNTHLIDVDTIKRCEKIPKDYMMGKGIITTIRHTTIEKEETKLISEEVDVTIWGVFVVQSEEINENKNMNIGKGILTSKTNSDDERQVEIKHLQLLIYNTKSYTIKIKAENKKLNVYCLYSENEVVNFFNDDLRDKKKALLDLYEEQRKDLENEQYIFYDLTIENDEQMITKMKKEKNVYYIIMSKRGGLFPCWHGHRTKGSQRSCVHDALLNACDQFGIYVNKEVLYREFPVQRDVNAQIEMVMKCSSIQKTNMMFQHIVIRQYRGGPENWIRNREKEFSYVSQK